MLNAYWEPLVFELPPTAAGERWHRLVDTALDVAATIFAIRRHRSPCRYKRVRRRQARVVRRPGKRARFSHPPQPPPPKERTHGQPIRRHHHRQRRRRRHAGPASRPLRQKDPAPRARRLAHARAGELERRRSLRQQPLRLARHLARQEWQAVPARRPLLRRRRDEDVRRGALPPAQGRLQRACSITTASRRPGRSATTSSSRTTRKAEQMYHVHGARGEDPTEPPCERAVSVSARLARAADPEAGRRPGPRPATTRSTRPAASCSTKRNMPFSRCVRCIDCDGFPCLVHAKSDAEVLGVRPALEHPNVTLLTNAMVTKLETNAGRHRGHRGRRRRTTAQQRESTEASIVVVSCGAANSAKLLLMSANDKHPARPGQRLRPGRPQLHVPQQPGGARALEGAEPDAVPEDARPQRLLLRHAGLRVPDGQHPDGRQVAGPDVPRREADRNAARAAVVARNDRPARRRLLALDRRPAAAGEPRHRRRATATITLSYTPIEPGRQAEALREAQVDAQPARHARPPDPAQSLHEERDRHRRRRPPGGHLPLRQRSEDVGARRELQGPRTRQPVRRRHQLLPQHRRGEPRAHRDGQRAARRRSLAGTNRQPEHSAQTIWNTLHKEHSHESQRKSRHRHRRQQRHRHGDRARTRPARRQHRHRLRLASRSDRGPRKASRRARRSGDRRRRRRQQSGRPAEARRRRRRTSSAARRHGQQRRRRNPHLGPRHHRSPVRKSARRSISRAPSSARRSPPSR